MNHKFPSDPTSTIEFDSLALYHHTTYDFESKLLDLQSILDMPKEYKLAERFKKVESVLDKTFRVELLYRLHLIKPIQSIQPEHSNNAQNISEHHPDHPKILLHLWCLLGCTDSVEYIANYLELTVEEVQELIRELHHTFSIDSLMTRIRRYYEQNKRIQDIPELRRQNELLGIEQTFEPKETTEERKQRLRKRYGHLAKVFDLMCHTP